MKFTFKMKLQVVALAKEKGAEIASEHYEIPVQTVETWTDMYTGENLYRKACEYSVDHGVSETAKILGVSERTFYRIRQRYGKRSEKKDRRKKVKESYNRKVADLSKELGSSKETAKRLGTNVDIVYRARRAMLATNANKHDNIVWDFIKESGYKSTEVCEYCGVTRTALSNYASDKKTTSPNFRNFVVAMFAYKMNKLGKISDEMFEKYWNKCRSDV